MEISFPFKKACVYYIRFQCHAYKNILKYNLFTWIQYTAWSVNRSHTNYLLSKKDLNYGTQLIFKGVNDDIIP